jgi:hypothetical protein
MRCAWLVGLLLPLVACVDESHELQVQALGPEDPSVPRGPLHRPGQPCVVCHGSEGPASTRFLMAGTVYAVEGQDAPADNAQVSIEGITGSTYVATTNAAGNFFIKPDQWTLTYPAQAQVWKGSDLPRIMGTHINRDGSCADCHALQAGPTSPGRVYLALAPLTDATDGGP